MNIIGLINGIMYREKDRVDELNERISQRKFPDVALKPKFEPRPISTKYNIYPIYENRISYKENYIPYDVNTVFNPGKPPSEGFRVDVETVLRNQTTSLQHGAHRGIYIPSSTSDLYVENKYF